MILFTLKYSMFLSIIYNPCFGSNLWCWWKIWCCLHKIVIFCSTIISLVNSSIDLSVFGRSNGIYSHWLAGHGSSDSCLLYRCNRYFFIRNRCLSMHDGTAGLSRSHNWYCLLAWVRVCTLYRSLFVKALHARGYLSALSQTHNGDISILILNQINLLTDE